MIENCRDKIPKTNDFTKVIMIILAKYLKNIDSLACFTSFPKYQILRLEAKLGLPDIYPIPTVFNTPKVESG